MIPVYNSTEYLEKTLESVLCQDPGPDHMQIEVVDGHSTRNEPSALVRRVAGDRVAVFRHPEPLPMYANWNSCIERARGEWVHILHSDDLVLPGFYSRLRESLAPRPELGAAFVRWSIIDENGVVLETAAPDRPEAGVLEHALERLSTHVSRIQFPAMVVRKSAYTAVGGFSSQFVYALDWEMWSRIAARYPIWYEPAVLACYRRHLGSETFRLRRTNRDCEDFGKCMAAVAKRLPAHSATRDRLAANSIRTARDLFIYRQVGAGCRQLWITLGIRSSPAVMRSMLSMLGWSAFQACRAGLRKFGLAPPRRVA
jgi:glycosyltransferase involved in cell wall biosynthesis